MAVNKSVKPSGMPHISLDERGRAWIDGTTMRVELLVGYMIGPDRLSPEEILDQFPHSNLNRARIHAAMTWYYDHQAEMDAEFDALSRLVEQGREEQKNWPLVARIRALRSEKAMAASEAGS